HVDAGTTLRTSRACAPQRRQPVPTAFRRTECGFPSSTCLRCLHSRKKRIEFAVERVELRLGCACQGVEVLDRYQHGLWCVVLRDHDGAALNSHLQHATKLTLRFTGGHRSGLQYLPAAVSKCGNASPPVASTSGYRRSGIRARDSSLHLSILS